MPTFNWEFPYASARMPVLASSVAATSQPVAAQAGLKMLERGGSAVDAALAAAITLTVVEPTSNGIGSDAFAIVWDGRQIHGLNASGRSPASLSPRLFAGQRAMATRGWASVTVPGAVSAWAELSSRFGKLPFEDLFEPAIRYAADGFLVSPITAFAWRAAASSYADYPEFAAAFLPGGRAPAPGERFRLPDQARTLQQIAETRGESFYRGELARQIVSHSEATGGWLTQSDLESHRCDRVETATMNYRGLTLHEIPPNGQGLAALIALGILQRIPVRETPVDSADSLHFQIEAMKLALADAHRYVADPDAMTTDYRDLLSPSYLEQRALLVSPHAAGDHGHGNPRPGGTVYLTTADPAGMMVSYIQSNFHGFGSGIVVPQTGISLQNRGAGFTLEEGHPNQVGGSKRPFHTIIPAFVTEAGKPILSFGVMGGAMQAQGHVQMMVRLFDYGQNPQAAADAPRWQVLEGRNVIVEAGVENSVRESLMQRGHRVSVAPPCLFGGCQMIYRLNDGYCAASDPRKDGQAVGF